MTTNLKFPINYTYQTAVGRSGNETMDSSRLSVLASFPGSPEREINTRGEPGIFSHVIKIGPEFLEQKGNVLSVIQPALHSTLDVYDIRSPIVIYM